MNKFGIINYYRVHLIIAFLVRLIFIAYGVYHDQYGRVAYTDLDYKVFTDAARHVIDGNSPYDRHTYRYSPLIAFILTVNLTLHHVSGKVIFSAIDLLIGVLIKLIVEHNVKEYQLYKKSNNFCQQEIRDGNKKNKPIDHKTKMEKNEPNESNFNSSDLNEVVKAGNLSMLVWIYNPMSIAISTRGSCDSIAGFSVLSTLYFLECKSDYFISGIILGIAMHFRIYPVIYSLSIFMYLSNFSSYQTSDGKMCKYENMNETDISQPEDAIILPKEQTEQRKTIFKNKYLFYLIPNWNQLKLMLGCFSSLIFLTLLFYYMYGYKFLFEAYVYHLIRKDTRHNFSLYFYIQYLTAGVYIGAWQKILVILPQIILLLVLSIRYGLNKYSLNFAVLTLTIVMVIYNTVLTSQYFMWIMAVLPLCIWQIQISFKKFMVLFSIWYAAQFAWLLPAYLLEFEGHNTFLFIWVQSISLFCANIAILGRLIKNFGPVKEHHD